MTVELLKPHTHAGKDYAPGETIDLDEGAARWLIEQGVAKAAPPSPASPLHEGERGKKPNRKGE